MANVCFGNWYTGQTADSEVVNPMMVNVGINISTNLALTNAWIAVMAKYNFPCPGGCPQKTGAVSFNIQTTFLNTKKGFVVKTVVDWLLQVSCDKAGPNEAAPALADWAALSRLYREGESPKPQPLPKRTRKD